MRDYGKISPQFWIGKTGKALRGNQCAQIVALYLMTSPHSEMTGIFHCPILYIAHETGLQMEGASKGLASLIEADFCTFEAETDTIFVHEMARYQIGGELKESDNRVLGVQKLFANMPETLIKQGFYEKYASIFYLENEGKKEPKKVSPSKAPSKPRTRTRTETGLFEQFWSVYPKKKNKGKAELAFAKLAMDDELLQTILQAVEVASQSDDWRKSNGQFIPHPSSWLNARGWEDESPGGGGLKPWEQ